MIMKLRPTARYCRLSDIPLAFLKENEIKLVFLDMDNTLAPWHSDAVQENFIKWISLVKENGIQVALLTNSNGENANFIGKKASINVHKGAVKPFKKETLKVVSEYGIKCENVLMVGDQLFTDIQLANSIKAKSVLTVPLEKREWWCTKVFNRSREKLVWRFIFGKNDEK